MSQLPYLVQIRLDGKQGDPAIEQAVADALASLATSGLKVDLSCSVRHDAGDHGLALTLKPDGTHEAKWWTRDEVKAQRQQDPLIVHKSHAAFLGGAKWQDDGSIDAAYAAITYHVLERSPGMTVQETVAAIAFLRSRPPVDLSDRDVEVRAMLDRRENPNRTTSAQAELAAREARRRR